MEIYRIEDDKYKVINGGHEEIMSLDEVMALLSTPNDGKTYTKYESNEYFWRDE
jgi:hypothetical protein